DLHSFPTRRSSDLGDPWKKPSLSEQRTDPIDITIRSSPPSEVDPVDRLQKYINFLMNKSPSQSAMLLTAQDALIKAGHNFNTLTRINDNQFEKLSIPDGIVMQLRININR